MSEELFHRRAAYLFAGIAILSFGLALAVVVGWI